MLMEREHVDSELDCGLTFKAVLYPSVMSIEGLLNTLKGQYMGKRHSHDKIEISQLSEFPCGCYYSK